MGISHLELLVRLFCNLVTVYRMVQTQLMNLLREVVGGYSIRTAIGWFVSSTEARFCCFCMDARIDARPATIFYHQHSRRAAGNVDDGDTENSDRTQRTADL